MNSPHRRATPLAVALALTLTACGGKGDSGSQRAVEEALRQEGITADVGDDGSMSFDTDNARVATSTQLPDAWPSDIALPDDFEVLMGGEVGNEDGTVMSVSGLASATVEELDAFYAAALSGWTETVRFSAADSLNVGYELGARSLQVALASTGDETTVTLSHVLAPGSPDVPPVTDAAQTASSSGGLTDALDQVGLETKGYAIVSAAGADRYEVDGSTIHIYFGDDAGVPAGIECMVVVSVLSEGEQAVVHRDGTETVC